MPFSEANGRGGEQGWVQEALAGDKEAFARLVDLYQRAVYNLAYRMLGDAREAEDAAQEAFLRAYSQLRRYDPSRRFSSWLLSIAAHYCIDLLRRRRYQIISLGDLPFGFSSKERDPGEEVVHREEEEEVRQLLQHLPSDYRLAVILYYWNGLSCRQIGEVLGSGEGAVKSRLYRARQILAQRLRAMNLQESSRRGAERPDEEQ